MKIKGHIIKNVQKGSIAEELELDSGDRLISVNGKEAEDVFDYHYLINEEFLTLLVEKKNGEEWELEIEKEFEEDLGMEFENGLMDEYRSCRNKCAFCFIDQMPKNMRETLYFKDDDSRLSFLQGNYITLTNMSEHDIDRIIQYRLEPINISVHTTNPDLRCRMLNNRFAGEVLKNIKKLYEAGIQMNGQIVLCRGINDGEELERTISELAGYLPYLQSVSVVPVGLTKFREGLVPLEPFGKEDAETVLKCIQGWQEKLYREKGTHFIHAGDEWYLLAGREVPLEESYDGYLQLENGVGMVRLLIEETQEALKKFSQKGKAINTERKRQVSIATGMLVYPYIRRLADEVCSICPQTEVWIYPIRNDFFGERITVTGLLTGQDLKRQLRGKNLGEELLLSCDLLKNGEEVLLDDCTVEELENALQTRISIVESSGQAFVEAVLGHK